MKKSKRQKVSLINFSLNRFNQKKFHQSQEKQQKW